jgi:hypothetical protein
MSSFRKKGPGVFASGVIGAAAGLAIVGGPIALLSYAAVLGKDEDASRFAPAQQDAVVAGASSITSARP